MLFRENLMKNKQNCKTKCIIAKKTFFFSLLSKSFSLIYVITHIFDILYTIYNRFISIFTEIQRFSSTLVYKYFVNDHFCTLHGKRINNGCYWISNLKPLLNSFWKPYSQTAYICNCVCLQRKYLVQNIFEIEKLYFI